MSNARAIITLTTDFGLADGYVASMKAVILGACPGATLVDITHEIDQGDILRGALVLEATAPYFPGATVHLAVVDPGVGSGRKGIALGSRGQYFVGPDNGLFTPFFNTPGAAAYALSDPGPEASPTFHGRDVFAPAAARLVRGAGINSLGSPLKDPVRLDWPTAEIEDNSVRGKVIYIDRFGNCVTSIKAGDLEPGRSYAITAAGRDLGPLRKYYAEVPPGEALALINSMGRVEVAVNAGSAAAAFGIGLGDGVIVQITG